MKQPAKHWAGFIVIIVLGIGLRFWQLEVKPLWLDEVITALITTGHRYRDVPLDRFFSLSALDQIFALQPGVSCGQITQTLVTESVHPPVFFCLLYQWLNWLQPSVNSWIWALRSLPALFGAALIIAIYFLNRIAFSPSAGLMGAALMAVSPFAVYLSQEARHYTLPMLLIVLALTALIQIQREIKNQPRSHSLLWLAWAGINALGLYVHYFFALAVIAQMMAMAGWMIWQKVRLRDWLKFGIATLTIGVSYLPWLPTMISHFSRPETDWLRPYDPDWLDRLAPLYQTAIGWVLMLIALPVESQPLAIALLSALIMTAFTLWLIPQIYKGLKSRWQTDLGRSPLFLIAGFVIGVLIQFFAIVYLLDKDITAIPRYNFVYYPGMCALFGAALTAPRQTVSAHSLGDRATVLSSRSSLIQRTQLIVLLAGLCSSIIVIYGFAFQKAYHPQQVARDMILDPGKPIAVVMSYESLQDIALGLSFALQLRQYDSSATPIQFAFLHRESNYRQVWRDLRNLSLPLPLPLNLWVVAPGLRVKQYPEQLQLAQSASNSKVRCAIDRDHYYRIGIPYQLYRCTGTR
jgi:uncharacterized membrane protein